MSVSNKVKKLFNFICKNDVASVKTYLEKGVNPNEKNKDNCTMLYIAVEHRHIDIIKLLLDRGADPNIYSSNCMTPLHSVAVIIPIGKILKLITKYGNLVTLTNYLSTFFVYNESKNLEIAKMLIQNGALVKTNNMKNITPLHIASSSGSYKMVELLLSHGANVNALNSYGETPLHYSVSSNDLNVTGLLIENGTNVNVANKDSITALLIAVEIGSIELVRLLLDKGADTSMIGIERFKLYVTEIKQNNNIFKTNNVNSNLTMIKEYIASELYDWNRHSATSKLMFRPHFEPCTVPVTLATRKGSKELLEILLEYGCNPDICEKTSTSAMHYAVIQQHYELLNILIHYDAYTDAKDSQQNTPAHYAAKLPRSESCKYLKLLKLGGASFNIRNRKGRTPLHSACKYDNVESVKFLIENGCDTSIIDVMSFTSLNYAVYHDREYTVKVLLESGYVDPNLCNYKELSPIMQAIRRNNKNIIKMLLDARADVKPVNECYGLHMLAALHNKDLLRWLLSTISEVDVNSVDNHYVPLASYVAELSDNRIMEILIDKGLDLNKVLNSNETMFTMIFSDTSHLSKPIVELLISQIAIQDEGSADKGFEINRIMIQSDECLLDIYQECKNQVSKMRKIKLGDNFTVMDLYKNRRSINTNLLARYAIPLSAIDLCELSMYSKYLEIVIKPAIKRYEIVNTAKDVIKNMLCRKNGSYWNLLPLEIQYNVLEYLDSKDLVSLIHNNTTQEVNLSHIFV
ncbi:ankyrin repeat family protein [Flamingopox virus FGPVKD09]|uniref:Ankyrin repeat family protein n=1 Tax=Flamingopox virus FGPVKD09 TaxID=2059380 RepID=A0A2H4X2Q0_9POXV|nr:ankyrin repeat family protein [Flamingopox virus FGPVKD09]AUD40332.1 ankyrin repeat family protein [Flamingopox virus FGPVKD09]